ncbi:MAG: site-specific integrase [Devosia nanyangense]|uniref:Site-specific integrase n=1 Tax=Devosia nanyangense TaxID=1228055 RepID=A0A933L2F0_9HYPH|nr:site-specific integrase [Devosia nanyangense]
MLRFRQGAKTRWMGLGPRDLFTLTEAKRRALPYRQLVHDKVDPIEARRRERTKQTMVTFGTAAERYAAAHKAGWSSKKHATNFTQQLKLHAKGIWDRPVGSVKANDVVAILEPLWASKPTTAGKLRSRLARVLDWAAHAGYREGPNPASWKGALEHRLPPLGRVQIVVPRRAIAEAPAVYAKLKALDSTAAKVIRLIALTAARPSEAREARAGEFDLDAAVWTVPPERAKSRRPHRVPLAPEAVALLRPVLASVGRSGLLFAGQAPGRPISDVAVRALLRDVAGPDSDLHGWRSTARTWMADNGWPSDVAEAALAHVVGSKLVQAYQRSDFFEQRVALMKAWSDYLAGGPK